MAHLPDKLTTQDFRTHVREFRQYGYDPYNSDFAADERSSCGHWWFARQAIDANKFDDSGDPWPITPT